MPLLAFPASRCLGGHTRTRDVYGEIGVVQFDAHADLREEFEGTPYSHASVMKRIVDEGIPTLAVGIRSLSTPEAKLVKERGLPVIWGHQLDRAEELFPAMLAALPEKIYLTFDIDYFDPSLVPAYTADSVARTDVLMPAPSFCCHSMRTAMGDSIRAT